MSSNCAMRSRWFISSLSIGSFFKSSISWEVGSKWYVDSNPGPASDYDYGWFNINDTSLNNVLKTHNLGTMCPKVGLFIFSYYDVSHFSSFFDIFFSVVIIYLVSYLSNFSRVILVISSWNTQNIIS